MVKATTVWVARIAAWIVGIGLAAFLLLAAALRFWILPQVESHKARIAQAISDAVGLNVRLARVHGDWRGLRPRLTLEGLQLFAPDGRPGLIFDTVDATVSWLSPVVRTLLIHRLEIDRPVLSVRRDPQGRLFVAGIELNPEQSGGGSFSDWFLQHHHVSIRDAVVAWKDDASSAPPLLLRNLSLELDNRFGRHRFTLKGTPPAVISGPLLISGDLVGGKVADLKSWSGRIEAQAPNADVAGLRLYVPLTEQLQSGRGDMRVELQASQGRIARVAADLDLRAVDARLRVDLAKLALAHLKGKLVYEAKFDDVDKPAGFVFSTQGLQLALAQGGVVLPRTDIELHYRPGDQRRGESGELKANAIDIKALLAIAESLPLSAQDRERLATWSPQGKLLALKATWSALASAQREFSVNAQFKDLGWRAVGRVPGALGLSGSVAAHQDGGTFSIAAGASQVHLPKVFAAPLRFDNLTAQSAWKRTANGVTINVQNVAFANSEVAGTVFGSYRSAPKGPGWIDLTGNLTRGSARGVANYLPFVVAAPVRRWLGFALLAGTGSEGRLRLKGDLYHFPFAGDRHGTFQITANVKDGVLRYAEPWPRIDHIDGTLDFHGERMEIRANSARVFGAQLHKVRAVIPSLISVGRQELQIEGEASGPLQENLKFLANSPIREKLPGLAEKLKATGAGKLALRIDIPLHHMADARVAGVYTFADNSADDGPGGIPALAQIKGALRFSRAGLEAGNINAQALGGPVTLHVSRGAEGALIRAKGQGDLALIQRDYPHQWFKRLQGASAWDGSFTLTQRGTRIALSGAGTLYGGAAKWKLDRNELGELQVTASGKANRGMLAQAFPQAGWDYIDALGDWQGALQLRGDSFNLRGSADARIIGGGAKLEVASDGKNADVIFRGEGRAELAALAQRFQHPLLKTLSGGADWSGSLTLRAEEPLLDVRAQAQNAGQPMTITVRGPTGKLAVSAEGHMEVATLARQLNQPLLTRLKGSTDWRADFGLGKADQRVSFSSSLVGLSSELPAPLNKSAPERLPLSLEMRPANAREELVLLRLGQRLSAQALRARAVPGAEPRLARAEVAFGANAPYPSRDGIWVSGAVPALDMSGWQAFDSGGSAAVNTAAAAPASLRGVRLNCAKFYALGREFSNVNLQARRTTEGWEAALAGDQLAGRLSWLSAGAGKLSANFQTLVIPDSKPPSSPAAAKQARQLPALDISAEDFRIKTRRLGKLEVNALPEEGAWRLQLLRISSPEALFQASGVWHGFPAQSSTVMGYTLKVTDAGKLLTALDYPKTMERGEVDMKGELSWLGAPFDFAPGSLSGRINLLAKNGQFLKADPGGAAKLLALISLQGLPRRIALDFRDVFSQGFAFETVSGNITIAKGLMRTEDFKMLGTSAQVAMTGEADANTESQRLRVTIVPALGSSVAIAGALAGGPAVGLGTLVLQKLLKDPFDKAFAFEYDIKGTWDNPEVVKVARAQPAQTRPRR